jgi:hypothetical protein
LENFNAAEPYDPAARTGSGIGAGLMPPDTEHLHQTESGKIDAPRSANDDSAPGAEPPRLPLAGRYLKRLHPDVQQSARNLGLDDDCRVLIRAGGKLDPDEQNKVLVIAAAVRDGVSHHLRDLDNPAPVQEPDILPNFETLKCSAESLQRGDGDALEKLLIDIAGENFTRVQEDALLGAVKLQTGVKLDSLNTDLKRFKEELASLLAPPSVAPAKPKKNRRAERAAAEAAKPVVARRTLAIGSDVEIAQGVADDLHAQFGEIVFDEGEFYCYDETHWRALSEEEKRKAVHLYDGATYFTPEFAEQAVRLSKSRIDSVLNEMRAKLWRRDFFEGANWYQLRLRLHHIRLYRATKPGRTRSRPRLPAHAAG